MLFVWIVLWTIGAVLMFTDPRRQAVRWAAAMVFTGGSGGMSAVNTENIKPFALAHGAAPELMNLLDSFGIAASLVCYYGLPYSFIIFAVMFCPEWVPSALWRQRLRLFLLLPIVPAVLFIRPFYPIPYLYTAIWAVPYIGIATCMLIISSMKEKNSLLRRNRLLPTIAAVPSMIFAAFTLYILPNFELYERWRYNLWIAVFTMLVFVVSSFRYGFLGLHISVRTQRIDYTLRAITSGTAILNHAIKNDVGKIKLFSEKIKGDAEDEGNTELQQDIQVVINASQHISEMIGRIHGQTREIALKLKEEPLAELLHGTLMTLQPRLGGLEIIENNAYDGLLLCDRAQLQEVFTNLIMNAAESMPGGGKLYVSLMAAKKTIVLEIRDTGTGMDTKTLKQVFDPFFTTKTGGSLNFGLGLSYCYSVIQKHRGTMEIHSKPGFGTTVYLNFKKKKRG